LNAQLKVAKEDSLLVVKDKDATKLELQVELVKYVAGVKIAEDVARKETADKKRELELLMTALADKKVDAIKNMTEEEIRKKIEQLQG